ncbi:hypothetical protein KEJ47_01820 [Candidatus Bathyarchaeota archaeon]|nr:hypothetical protein [Candidatus Bathyarchaeota archaeon]
MSKHENRDPINLLGFGVFIIIVSLIIINFPNVFNDLFSWFRSLEFGKIIIIPNSLIWPLIWLLIGGGVWNLASCGIRLLTNINKRKSISDGFRGLFFLVSSFFLREYSYNLISFTSLLSSLLISLGTLIVLSSILSYKYLKHN